MGCNCKSKRASRSTRPSSRRASRRPGKNKLRNRLRAIESSEFERKPIDDTVKKRKGKKLRKVKLSKDE